MAARRAGSGFALAEGLGDARQMTAAVSPAVSVAALVRIYDSSSNTCFACLYSPC